MKDMPASEGGRRLTLQIQAAEKLLEGSVSKAELHAWTKTTEALLSRIYDSGSSVVKGLITAAPSIKLSAYKNPNEMAEYHRQTLQARASYVKSAVESLSEDIRSGEAQGTTMALEEPNRLILTWSGKTSQQIAQFLYTWWPNVVPGATPWISIEDIAKGDRWFPELMKQLGKSTTCVLCVTPENHKAPWVYYEAGVIAAKQEQGKVCTVLFGITTSNINGTPLAQFQATEADESDLWRLVKAINGRLTEGMLEEEELRSRYDNHWPEVKAAIDEALLHSKVPTETAETIELLSEYRLSDDAKELLREACKDRNGRITYSRTRHGSDISTNARDFIEDGSARSEARWKNALEELGEMRLIEDRGHKGEVFAITHRGFTVGDSL
jgi:hypothetical protein